MGMVSDTPENFVELYQFVKDHADELDSAEVQEVIIRGLSDVYEDYVAALLKNPHIDKYHPEYLWEELWGIIFSISSLTKKILEGKILLQISDILDQDDVIVLLTKNIRKGILQSDEELRSLMWQLFRTCLNPVLMAEETSNLFSVDEIVDMLSLRVDDVRLVITEDPSLFGDWSGPLILDEFARLLRIPGVVENSTLVRMIAQYYIDTFMEFGLENDFVFTDLSRELPFKPILSELTDRDDAIRYLQLLYDSGDWELAYLALYTEWHQLHMYKYYSEVEMRELNTPTTLARYMEPRGVLEKKRKDHLEYAEQSMNEYRDIRTYLFNLFGIKYDPMYNFERYGFIFKGLYEAISSPKDVKDMFRQIRKYFKDTYGQIELIADNLE